MFQKYFGAFKEAAQREPMAITSNGYKCIVLISTVDYMAYQKFKNESQNEDQKWKYSINNSAASDRVLKQSELAARLFTLIHNFQLILDIFSYHFFTSISNRFYKIALRP